MKSLKDTPTCKFKLVYKYAFELGKVISLSTTKSVLFISSVIYSYSKDILIG